MKKLTTTLFALLVLSITSFGQDITGDWYGKLDLGVMDMRIVFHINKSDEGYTTVLDSPDQQVNGIETTSTTYESETIEIIMDKLRASYSGKLASDSLLGTFSQNGQSFPLNLSRNPQEKTVRNRPQTPLTPYPYTVKEVKIRNKKDDVTLAGTLTIPTGKGPFPAVVLVSGSGPQDRDEAILEHKPFLVLADYLTRQGIAVLRYDDRGFGKSTGQFSSATTFDFANDAEAVFEFVRKQKGINQNKVGIIGHSEGGYIAPIIESRNSKVAFTVLLAGPAVPGHTVLQLQHELISRANGVSEDEIESDRQIDEFIFKRLENQPLDPNLPNALVEPIDSFLQTIQVTLPEGKTRREVAILLAKSYGNPWMHQLLILDPTPYLQAMDKPSLILLGENDLQVPLNQNQTAFNRIFEVSGQSIHEIHVMDKMNHLFQRCETGSPSEYIEIETTIEPDVLSLIGQWILNL